jgi:hypothetical protein
MVIHVPRSILTERTLLDAFHVELDATGRIALPAHLRITPQRILTRAELEECGSDEPSEGGAEASSTGPKRVNEADRSVSGVANVLSISRSGIKLHISGLELEHYNKCNPVVLAAHEQVAFSTLMPGAIATVERAYKAKQQTELRFRNMTFDTDPLAEAWFQKVLKGIVRMVSVGFLPIEWNVQREEEGRGKDKREIVYIDIPQSELLEISVVPIGANRGALIGQHSAHVLLERIAAAEQRTAELQQAIDTFIQHEQQTAVAEWRERLLKSCDEFLQHGG